MKNLSILFGILLLLAPRSARAQTDPCGLDFKFDVTRAQLVGDQVAWQDIGRRMQSCERLVLLSDTAYTSIIIEQAFAETLNARLESLVAEMEQGRDLRDTLITRQEAFIRFQREQLQAYDDLLQRSNQLVADATKNTDRALLQLSLVKWGAVGIVAGALVGALVLK